jgi:hypothetical protein
MRKQLLTLLAILAVTVVSAQDPIPNFVPTVTGQIWIERATPPPFPIINQKYIDTNGNYLRWDGNAWIPDVAPQTLVLVGNDLSISGGNTVTLPSGGSADNLGNHLATQNLGMAFYNINDATVINTRDVNATNGFFDVLRATVSPTTGTDVVNKAYFDGNSGQNANEYYKTQGSGSFTLSDSQVEPIGQPAKTPWMQRTTNDTITLADSMTLLDRKFIGEAIGDSILIREGAGVSILGRGDYLIDSTGINDYQGVVAYRYSPVTITKEAPNTFKLVGDFRAWNPRPPPTANLYDVLNAANPENETNSITGFQVDSGTLTISTDSDAHSGVVANRIDHNGLTDTPALAVLDLGSSLAPNTQYTVKVYLKRGAGSTGNWEIRLEAGKGWSATAPTGLIQSSIGNAYELYTLTATRDAGTNSAISFAFNSNSDPEDIMLIDNIHIE